MKALIAALPMYDWPEARAEVDAQWAAMRDRLRAAGIDAPDALCRRNADMPAVPGGIRDLDGRLLAPDPATLPPDELDLPTLWRHPDLLLAQTCWGPMNATFLRHRVLVVGQPDYSDVPGGAEVSYSSAILMRADDPGAPERDVAPPPDEEALLPLDLLRGRRFAFNEEHSMSGWLALTDDLREAGEDRAMLGPLATTGGHRASMQAVAAGRADVCAVDCRSLTLARRFEPAAAGLRVIGWTRRRLGLPYICARRVAHLAPAIRAALRPPMDIESLRRRLISSGIADETAMLGCSDTEIAAIEERYGPLPASYREILGLIGRRAGWLVDAREMDFFADRLDAVNESVAEAVAEADEDEQIAPPPPGAFFISARYLEYQSCLLANGAADSPVWTYDEDMTRLEKAHDSVWDWIMGFVADAEFWIGVGSRGRKSGQPAS
ncbi:MAG: PhnD/SsuA/transferrin family substrate-binding protein [Mesorhizobium sp.]